VRSTDSLVKIGKWVTDRDGASEESEEVITITSYVVTVDPFIQIILR